MPVKLITDTRTAPLPSNTQKNKLQSQGIITPSSPPQSPQTFVEQIRLTPSVPKIEMQILSSFDRNLQELEREISVVASDGRPIGPEHFIRLNTQLDEALTAGANQESIQKLRTLLATVDPNAISSASSHATPSPTPPPTAAPSKQNCTSNPSPVFTNHITDIHKVNYVATPPTMGAGPSLKTHSYIGTDHARVPIYAPTAMTLKSGSHYVGGPYMFEFQVSCEVVVRFGHVTNPVDSIKNLLPSEPKSGSQTQELNPVSFAAGEVIAYTTGTDAAGNWDFGVYNSATTNRYVNDANWNNSATYTTAVCPFEYFTQDLKSMYASKFNASILGGNPPHGESFCNI